MQSKVLYFTNICRESYKTYEDYAYVHSPIGSRNWSNWLDESEKSPSMVHFTSTEVFITAAKICREFLSTFLAGPVLDSLSESARQVLLTEDHFHLLIADFLGCESHKSRTLVQLFSVLRRPPRSTDCASPCRSDQLPEQILGKFFDIKNWDKSYTVMLVPMQRPQLPLSSTHCN